MDILLLTKLNLADVRACTSPPAPLLKERGVDEQRAKDLARASNKPITLLEARLLKDGSPLLL
jgi:hypothetical protein